MSDRVLIPLGGIGTLALDRETFTTALEAGAELIAPPSTATATATELVDAEKAAALLGLTARWLEDMARAGVCPHYKFGRFIRFDVRELAAHFRVEGATPTDSQSVTAFQRQVHQ